MATRTNSLLPADIRQPPSIQARETGAPWQTITSRALAATAAAKAVVPAIGP